jgi:hypothetical protein
MHEYLSFFLSFFFPTLGRPADPRLFALTLLFLTHSFLFVLLILPLFPCLPYGRSPATYYYEYNNSLIEYSTSTF